MNTPVKSVVSLPQSGGLSRLALAVCFCLSPFAQSSVAADAAEAADPGAAAAPESGAAPGSALQEIVINAQRTTAEVARKAQQEAPNLINVQTYSEIKKLPDITTAEAVRRIPGISLEIDEGEGRYVNIRGLDADLNSTTFGGLRLPPTNNASPFGGYRAVTLDSIPIGLVGAITVTKSNIPSMDAEALGGTIEITPKTAPPGGAPFIEGDVGGGYEDLRQKPLYIVSLSGGGRFGGRGAPAGTSTDAYSDHPFSIVATVTVRENWRGIDDVEPAYFNAPPLPYHTFNNLQQRDYELNRKRHGYGIDFGYQPNADNQWYLRAFEAGYSERYWRQFLNLNPDGLATAGPNGQIFDSLTGAGYSGQSPPIQMGLRDERESSKDQVGVLGGQNRIGGNTLYYRFGYTKGSWNKPYDYNSFFNYTPSTANTTIAYSPSGLGHTPLYTISGADYLNGANYTLGSFGNSSAYNYDKEKSVAIDLEIPVGWGGLEAQSVKIGASGRFRNKLTTNQPYTYPTLPPIVLGDIAVTGPETYYKGQYMNPPDIPPGYLQGQLGPGVITGIEQAQYLQQYLNATEDVYAGYAQYQVTLGKLGVIGGVRVEDTHSSGDAWNVLANSGTPVLDANGNPIATPVHGSHHYTDVLPGIQLRYELRPDLIARFAWSSTLARPGFNQNNASQTVDLGSSQVTVGNPNLRAATSTNFDLDIEKYLNDAGILQLGIFDKQISNYIVANNTGTEIVQGLPLRVYTYTNSPNAYARGVEFNWQQKFTSLPGFWNGFGLGANFTYVDSQFDIRPGQKARLPSSSEYTGNATIFYEKYNLTLRLAAYYVSADLFAIGTGTSSDIYNAERTFLDFGSAYAWGPHWSTYFNAKDLLNTPHAFWEGTSNRPIQREFYGHTFELGVRFSY